MATTTDIRAMAAPVGVMLAQLALTARTEGLADGEIGNRIVQVIAQTVDRMKDLLTADAIERLQQEIWSAYVAEADRLKLRAAPPAPRAC